MTIWDALFRALVGFRKTVVRHHKSGYRGDYPASKVQ